MGIGFNATFLIQMIHFCIAYFLFYRILFKPALAIISQERAHVNQLTAQIETDRIQLEERKHTQQHYWLAARNYFKKKSPTDITVKPLVHLTVQEITDTTTSDMIKNQSAALADMIVKRMESR